MYHKLVAPNNLVRTAEAAKKVTSPSQVIWGENDQVTAQHPSEEITSIFSVHLYNDNTVNNCLNLEIFRNWPIATNLGSIPAQSSFSK